MNKYCLLLTLALPGSGWASKPIQAVEPVKVKDPAKVELGKMLFFEPRLSTSNAISCNAFQKMGLVKGYKTDNPARGAAP